MLKHIGRSRVTVWSEQKMRVMIMCNKARRDVQTLAPSVLFTLSYSRKNTLFLAVLSLFSLFTLFTIFILPDDRYMD
ncbi:hypothetical protein Y032_0049g1856 [Ancylostoma ceylanicum]|uniref:Transmembrane protein n=1 Tax=Ancylostoma ceylanicum TaxID=53326 RepID=A0A016U9S1_9BILA|nr:hypothetical protein Y032_0049g1856 [Ancylostoma ceylanicum]